ncbi:MAG: MarR family transcriptional regulator [Psychrilyobacter sp.]|uniref:MarR family winged helix-turn-helix transcriptional regulator n=1 Tax=Psychrilyobacter sp. TaxID=2586924 RepID=UPI003C752479
MEKKEIIIDVLTVANAISMAGKELLNDVLEKHNISYKEYYLLRHLEKSPGETQYNLLKYTTLTKSRANQIVSKLEKMGYLEKKIEMVGSLLKKPLYLTESGKKIVIDGVEEIYANTIKDLSEEEKLEYKTYRSKMIEILVNMRLTLGTMKPEYLKE